MNNILSEQKLLKHVACIQSKGHIIYLSFYDKTIPHRST